LASDGRYTYESGIICSDTVRKWGEFGSVVCLWAGQVGGLWVDLEENPPRNWSSFREAIKDLNASEHGRDYEVLVYDRSKDRIVHTDHQGDVVLPGQYATVGCGAPYAVGALAAVKTPATLEAAAKLAIRAVKIACRNHSACGGRIRTVIVRGRKGAIEVR
jgi:hypothetical protein